MLDMCHSAEDTLPMVASIPHPDLAMRILSLSFLAESSLRLQCAKEKSNVGRRRQHGLKHSWLWKDVSTDQGVSTSIRHGKPLWLEKNINQTPPASLMEILLLPSFISVMKKNIFTACPKIYPSTTTPFYPWKLPKSKTFPGRKTKSVTWRRSKPLSSYDEPTRCSSLTVRPNRKFIIRRLPDTWVTMNYTYKSKTYM